MSCSTSSLSSVESNVAKRCNENHNLIDIDLHLQHTANVIVPHTDVLHLVMDGTYDTILDSGATCHVVNSIQYATPQYNFKKNTNPYDGIALGDNSIRLQSSGTCDIGILKDGFQ